MRAHISKMHFSYTVSALEVHGAMCPSSTDEKLCQPLAFKWPIPGLAVCGAGGGLAHLSKDHLSMMNFSMTKTWCVKIFID